jgi:hypothetical protein
MIAERIDQVVVTLGMKEYRMLKDILYELEGVEKDFGSEWEEARKSFVNLVSDHGMVN